MHALDLGYSPPGLMRKKKGPNSIQLGAVIVIGLLIIGLSVRAVLRHGTPNSGERPTPSLTITPGQQKANQQFGTGGGAQRGGVLPQSVLAAKGRARSGRRSLGVEDDTSSQPSGQQGASEQTPSNQQPLQKQQPDQQQRPQKTDIQEQQERAMAQFSGSQQQQGSATTQPAVNSSNSTAKEDLRQAVAARINAAAAGATHLTPSVQMQLQLQALYQLQADHKDRAAAYAAAQMQQDAAAVASNSGHSAEVLLLHRITSQIDHLHKQVDLAAVQQAALEEEERVKGVHPGQADALGDRIQQAEATMGKLSEIASVITLRSNDPLMEAAEDPVEALGRYYMDAIKDIRDDWPAAMAQQQRPSAKQARLDVGLGDAMDEIDSTGVRIGFINDLLQEASVLARCPITVQTTWSGDVWLLRQEFLPWAQYHAAVGVSRIMVMYDGKDAKALAWLKAMPRVSVLTVVPEFASAEEKSDWDNYRKVNGDASSDEWKNRPGNYEIMVKQGFATTIALQQLRADLAKATQQALAAGRSAPAPGWLIHIDPDELLYPAAGGANAPFAVDEELCTLPSHVPSVRFINVEGVPEAGGIRNRFEQITLFRSHRHLVPPLAHPYRYVFKLGHNEAWLNLYSNGKSAIRVDSGGHQAGPHVFIGPADKRWATEGNPNGIWTPAISNTTMLLHFAYATQKDVGDRKTRHCPPDLVAEARKGDAKKLYPCFTLDMDRRAYLAATAPEPTSVEDFFYSQLVMSEGAPFRCIHTDTIKEGWCNMRNVGQLKQLLARAGLLKRIHGVQLLLRGQEVAIRQRIRDQAGLPSTGAAAVGPTPPAVAKAAGETTGDVVVEVPATTNPSPTPTPTPSPAAGGNAAGQAAVPATPAVTFETVVPAATPAAATTPAVTQQAAPTTTPSTGAAASSFNSGVQQQQQGPTPTPSAVPATARPTPNAGSTTSSTTQAQGSQGTQQPAASAGGAGTGGAAAAAGGSAASGGKVAVQWGGGSADEWPMMGRWDPDAPAAGSPTLMATVA